MIFFKPCEVLSAECTALFQAFQNADKLGECRLLLNGDTADVYFLEYDEARPEIGEGLLKSAYNYAANRGAYMGTLSAIYPRFLPDIAVAKAIFDKFGKEIYNITNRRKFWIVRRKA